nr:uncharacterized protein LOC123767110 [Procambarus clarkii]
MKFQVTVCILGVVGLVSAVPVPSTATLTSSADVNQVDPEELSQALEITSKFLPTLKEALTNEDGTQIDRIGRITLAFLPLFRSVVDHRGRTSLDFDTEKNLKRQEAAERVVPQTLEFVKLFVDLLPETPAPTPTTFKTQDFNIPTFDSEFVPDQTIPEVRIPATKFVPEIVIPEIKIQ